jgi:adenosylhomocysteine nucleosidase
LIRHERRIQVAVAGVGRDCARRKALELVAAPARPRLVIMAGYAGALDPDLRVGDVVIASEVVDESGGRWKTCYPASRGRILTVDRLVGNAEEKRELGRRHQANAVDMESAAVAQVCVEHGVPFWCVRAISDDASMSLSPRLLRLFAGGGVSPARVCLELLRAPGILPELIRLGRTSKLAGEQLAKTLKKMIEA